MRLNYNDVMRLTDVHLVSPFFREEMIKANIDFKPLEELIKQFQLAHSLGELEQFPHNVYCVPSEAFLPLYRSLIEKLFSAKLLTSDFFQKKKFNLGEVKILVLSGVSLVHFNLDFGWSAQLTDVPVYSSKELDHVISKRMVNFWMSEKVRLTASQLDYCKTYAKNGQDLLWRYYVDHCSEENFQETFNKIFPFAKRTFAFYKTVSARLDDKSSDKQYLEASISADKPIFSLTNDELIKFAKWFSLSPVLACHEEVLKEKLFSVIKRPLSASFLKKLIEFYDETKSWKWTHWFDDKFIKELRQITQSVLHQQGALSTRMHDALLVLVVERKFALEQMPDQDYLHAPHSAVNQVFMALIWMLERAGYKAKCMRPAAFNEMGAELAAFCELNYNDIFIVQQEKKTFTFTTQDIITTLNLKGDLLDPLTYQPLNQEIIENVLYRKPAVRAEMRAYIDRWLQSCPDAVLSISNEVIEALEKLAQDLWWNSEDAGNAAFDETLANEQLIAFHSFMRDRLKDLYILDSCAFPLASRDGVATNYTALFAKATFEGCIGQLGLAIKDYVKQLKAIRENKKEGGLKEVPFEQYMKMSGRSMLHFQVPKEFESTGTELSKRLSISFGQR